MRWINSGIKSRLRKLFADSRGNALVLTGISIFALVGGAGLGTDTVQWFTWKRQLQQAADSGSLAGAHTLAQRSLLINEAVTTEVNRNANTTVIVQEINTPPTSGAYAGDATAVEVKVVTSRRLPFSSLFLNAVPTIPARAVAAFVKSGEHCVISLAPTGVGVNVAGGANVQLGCGVAANSAGNQALFLEGSAYLGATPLSTVGGIVAPTGSIAASTTVNPYGPPQADPIKSRNLEVPTSPSSCTANNFTVEANKPPVTLSPGRYCNGMALKGKVTLSPGVYIVDRGSFYLSSQADVTGQGVTIILTGSDSSNIATVKVDGGTTANLKAPTPMQDPYWKNILFYQDPRAAPRLSEFAGGSNFHMQGIAYFPSGDLRYTGGSGNTAECLFIVANRVTMTGSTSITNNCPSDFGDDFAGRAIRVVE